MIICKVEKIALNERRIKVLVWIYLDFTTKLYLMPGQGKWQTQTQLSSVSGKSELNLNPELDAGLSLLYWLLLFFSSYF